MSKVDGPAAIAACANLRSRNARSLFISGPTAAAREAGDISSYQPQKSRRTWSRTPDGEALADGVVAEQRGDVGQGDQPGAGRHRAEQGQARGAEDVVGPGSPEPGEDPPEDPGDVVHDHVGVGPADPSPCSTFRHGGACLVSPGSNSTTLPADASGRRAMTSSTASPLGSMKTTPRPASASARICPAISVVLPVPVGPQIRRWWRASGTARPTGRGWPGVGDAEGADAGAGQRDGGRRRDGACPGAGQAGQRRVGGQPGDRRQFRHRQQVALGQPAGADRGGGVAKAAAGEPVPPGEQGGGRGEGVGQAAQPGRLLLRGGGPPLPAAGAVAGLGGGGGGDRVADQGFPLRPGELGGGLADLGGQVGIGAAGGPAAAGCRARGWPGPAAGRSSGRTARTAACGRRGGPCGAGLRSPAGPAPAGRRARRRRGRPRPRPAPAAAPPGHGWSTAAGCPGGPAAASRRPRRLRAAAAARPGR